MILLQAAIVFGKVFLLIFLSMVDSPRDKPLMLRYQLHAHGGPLDADEANRLSDEFAARPAARVVKSSKKHIDYEIERV